MIGKWRRELRKVRRGDKKWWNHVDDATNAVNNKENENLRQEKPSEAVDTNANPLLHFMQSKKAGLDLQKSQKHADKKHDELEGNLAFRKPVQGPSFRKAPRKGDPNYEGRVEKIEKRISSSV